MVTPTIAYINFFQSLGILDTDGKKLLLIIIKIMQIKEE